MANQRQLGLAHKARTLASPPRGILQRQCACGQHTFSGVACEHCRKSGQTTVGDAQPLKALGVSAEDRDSEKPSPQQGSATIQCNGSGGYELVYGGWGGASCGTKDCVTAHESSHMADWQAKWPTGCQGQAKGYLPKGDPPDNPLMTAAEYQAFLKDSECKAHTADLACAQALPKTGACKTTVEDYIKLTEQQKANWCPSMPRWAKVALGIGGGALLGAGVGALTGVGPGTGAGIGALAGGVGGSLF